MCNISLTTVCCIYLLSRRKVKSVQSKELQNSQISLTSLLLHQTTFQLFIMWQILTTYKLQSWLSSTEYFSKGSNGTRTQLNNLKVNPCNQVKLLHLWYWLQTCGVLCLRWNCALVSRGLVGVMRMLYARWLSWRRLLYRESSEEMSQPWSLWHVFSRHCPLGMNSALFNTRRTVKVSPKTDHILPWLKLDNVRLKGSLASFYMWRQNIYQSEKCWYNNFRNIIRHITWISHFEGLFSLLSRY